MKAHLIFATASLIFICSSSLNLASAEAQSQAPADTQGGSQNQTATFSPLEGTYSGTLKEKNDSHLAQLVIKPVSATDQTLTATLSFCLSTKTCFQSQSDDAQLDIFYVFDGGTVAVGPTPNTITIVGAPAPGSMVAGPTVTLTMNNDQITGSLMVSGLEFAKLNLKKVVPRAKK